ncbi:MAG: disulfide bond formation protein B [Sphingopyxis sp.]
MRSLWSAHWFAFWVPAALLGGAWYSQLIWELAPCEMCHWQRWPHYAAVGIALLALFVRAHVARRALVSLAALCIAMSGAIGIFHAGVEYGWWEGLTRCTAPAGGSLEDIMSAPLTRCDVAPWDLFGISLAGYNAIVSLLAAGLILTLLRRARVVQP